MSIADQTIDDITKNVCIDLLPESMQELVSTIGLPATIKLIEKFPGLRPYIPDPRSIDADHVIAQTIGIDAATTLSELFGGDTLRLPKLDNIERQMKHRTLLALKEKDVSNSEIARQLNYSIRHVERLVSCLHDDNQMTLFDEK